VINLTKNI
jgi:hypothetical protein